MFQGMSEEGAKRQQDQKKPDPLEDLQKGFGLLFRAAKTAVEQLPSGRVEDVIKTGVKEVGRALENVTEAIAENVFHYKKPEERKAAPAEDRKPEAPRTDEPAADGPRADEPRGPRIE
jgi:hypothetical protein